MSFLNPFLLLSLLAVAVPLLIHLIHLRRPQKIKFSTLQFFEELRKTTVRRIKLKEYLLLALRILAVLCLALALARPFLPSALLEETATVTYVIILDNSPSMRQMDERGTWFVSAREAASSFVTNADARSRFLILPTHGPWTFPSPASAAEALRLISRIEPSEQAFRLGAHITDLQAFSATVSDPVLVYWFGDGQASTLKDFASGFETPLPFPVYVVKTSGEESTNVAVTGLQVLSRIISERRPVQFKATVTHFGSAAFVNGFISLEVNGNVTGQYPVSLEPGTSKEFVFEWTPPDSRPAAVSAVLEGDTWPFDNRRFLALDMPERKTILVIGEKTSVGDEPFYTKALSVTSKLNKTIDIRQVTPDDVTPELLAETSVFILNALKNPQSLPVELLREQVQSGRSLLFIPGNQSDQPAWNRFMAQFNVGSFEGFTGEFGSFDVKAAVKRPPADLPLVQDVFDLKPGQKPVWEMPSLFHYWNFKPTGFSIPLLQTEASEPLLTEHRVGQGVMVVAAFGTEPGWSDFPANSFYPVFWYRLLQVLSHREGASARNVTLGEPLSALFPFTETELEIKGTDFSVKPVVSRTSSGVKVDYDGLDWLPGSYRLVSASQSVGLSVNPDILESDFQTLSASDLTSEMKRIFTSADVFDASGASAEQRSQWMARSGRGREIWRVFLALGVFFLAAETLLSRQFKTDPVAA